MLIRIAIFIYAATVCADFIDFSYTRKFFAGAYPADADSIGIPIVFMQIFMFSSLLISSPVVILGNKEFRNWWSSKRRLFSVPLAVLFLFCYGFLFLAGLIGLSHISSEDFGFILFDAVALFLSVSVFFLIDMVRLCVFLKKIDVQDKFSWFFRPRINF
jgi:hypothetical protein